MSKSSVTLLFVGGVVAVVAGFIVTAIAVVSAIAGGLIVFDGSGIVGVDGSVAWTIIGPVALGGAIMAVGALIGIVSWLGALVNTYKLDDKTWFTALLVLGLVSFGFLAMVAYI